MLEANEKNVSIRCKSAAPRKAKQADERSGFLIPAVFGKARDNIANGRMEGIGLSDALDERLRGCGDRVDSLRLLERVHVSLGNFIDSIFRGEPIE
jgi:hypothetical protein